MSHPVKFGFNVSVDIIRDNSTDTAKVQVNCPMYINKTFIMPHSYKSSHFTDNQIMQDSDFIRVMFQHFPS